MILRFHFLFFIFVLVIIDWRCDWDSPGDRKEIEITFVNTTRAIGSLWITWPYIRRRANHNSAYPSSHEHLFLKYNFFFIIFLLFVKEEGERERRGRQEMIFVGDRKWRIIAKYSYHRSIGNLENLLEMLKNKRLVLKSWFYGSEDQLIQHEHQSSQTLLFTVEN